MSGNSFGNIFKVTTWGESHGPAIGAVVDGCPPNLNLCEKDIQIELDKRKPGQSLISSPRKEQDKVKILSGVFNGKTTGTPISMIVENTDQRSKDYSRIKDIFRPGHADYTYMQKYGIRDYRGGGRSSGRETIGRVMAGAVAKKILEQKKIKIIGHTIQIGSIKTKKFKESDMEKNPIRCADNDTAKEMINYILDKKKEGDSVGGIIEIIVKNVPTGLGEPVFDKLDAKLGQAIFSIGAVKGVEIGNGFKSAEIPGSKNNDEMIMKRGKLIFKSNNAGGISGGISTGEDIKIKIAVKPTPSISKKQITVNLKGKSKEIEITGRHDACIVPRLIPVAESMAAIVIADFYLLNKK